MKRRLKPSWDDVQKLLRELNGADLVNYGITPPDHPIGGIRNSGGQKIPIPVTLFKDRNAVLDATVFFYPMPVRLYDAALYMLELRMKENKISVDWDEVQFVGNSKLFPRYEPLRDKFVTRMDMALTLPLDDKINILNEVFEPAQMPGLIFVENLYYENLSATIVAHTATVVSEDMERMIYDRKWHLPGTTFKPKGLEF